jgi:pheromone shutdown protein TraB
MKNEIYNVDYTQFTHILGTTHFSKRSLYQAYKAVAQLEPTDLAVELDKQRYRILNSDCATCPQNRNCTHKCEFIGAVEALGNKDTNIWLIDMSRREFWQRMYALPRGSSHWRVLLHERDALMAARLAWIATRSLEKGETPSVLALVGAAHENGITSLLRNPLRLRERLRGFGLHFTPPAMIRRVMVEGD